MEIKSKDESEPAAVEKQKVMNEELDGDEDNSSIMSFDEEGLEDLPSSPLPYELSVYDSEEEYCPNYPLQNKRDEALWEKYLKQLDESENGYMIVEYMGEALASFVETHYGEEEYCPNYPDENMDKALWERYLQQLDESEGFDIKDYPGPCPMATVYPLPRYLTDPKNFDKLKGYAGRALKHYNDSNGTNHEVEDVLKVNGGGCCHYIYYITFTVKTSDGNKDFFQAKVVEDQHHHLEFPIVRPRAKKDLDI